MKKLLLSIFLVFGMNFGCFAANNATDVYLLAQSGSTEKLKAVENIDVVDSDGNTALCSAIKDNNVDAYNLLKNAGANTEHKCVKKIPSKQYKAFTQKLAATNKSWSFLGLGKWAWTAIGAGVAGGAVAAGMGGGGGGSSGYTCSGVYVSDGNGGCIPRDCSDFPFVGTCPAGWTFGDRCDSTDGAHYKCNVMNICPPSYQTEECPTGFVESDTCQSGDIVYRYCLPTICPYSTTSCSTGFHETGNTCQSGETIYTECEADTCDGYNIDTPSNCPSGYVVSDTCLSGNTTKYKCEMPATCSYDTTECTDGYVENGETCQSGETLYKKCVPATCPYTQTSCNTGYHETGNTCQSGETMYVECEANTCDGYDYTNANDCPAGYTIGSSCMAGNTMKYKCDNNAYCSYNTTECSGGYEETGNTCQSGETMYVQCQRISCTGSNAVWTSQGCSCEYGYENYVPGDGCSLISINCGPNAHQSGTNCICDDGYTDFRGSDIGCVTRTYYVYSISGQEHNIQNDNDNNLTVGMTSVAYNSNTSAYNSNNVTIQKTLNIVNNGDGDIRFPHVNLTQAILNSSYVLGVSVNANGTLYLENTGHGTIYGLVGSNYTGGNSHVELNIDSGVSGSKVQSDSLLKIKNIGNGDVYGMYGKKMTNADMTGTVTEITGIYTTPSEDATSNGIINIENHGGGNVYGIYDTDTTTKINSAVYNAYSDTQGAFPHNYPITVNGTIIISNDGDGDVYGMYSNNKLYAARAQMDQNVKSNSFISITNNGDGNVYGMYSDADVVPADVSSSSDIRIFNNGDGNVYGVFAQGNINFFNGENELRVVNTGDGVAFGLYTPNTVTLSDVADDIDDSYVSVTNTEHGTIYGVYGSVINSPNYGSYTIVQANNFSDGTAICLYGKNMINNSSQIRINNVGTGRAIGIYGEENSTINNHGDIYITRDNYYTLDNVSHTPTGISGDVFGIYVKSGSNVNNSGSINITSNGNMYGIYAEGNSTVTNTGTISLNGVSCSGAGCNTGNYIVLNGSTLYNSGLMMAPQMNLNSMGGNVVAGLGSQFVIENELSGDLNISSELVRNGNQTTYIAENMIDAGDISGLNVRSASVMFDASLADNGHDVVMTMKDFDSLTDNKSLSAFLTNNYANGNGSDLFTTLKSMDNMAAFNGALSGLTGLNTFTQFAHEDLSAMREISFSMNNKLFENSNRDSFDISDSMGYFSFSNRSNGGNGRYGISNEKISDNWKLGYGMAMANINTGDNNGMNRRNEMWLFYMPATYTNDGYELVVAPKAGFANSKYNRRGFNNQNYEGYIEKSIFGFMNDLRYPLTFGNWTIAPNLSFNTIVYEQSGHEDEQEFSLVIPDDRTVSVETGLGFYTKYEKAFSDGSRLKLNSGLMAYREFGDTYDIKLGIRGMDGTFSLYNNDYEYRGAASLGFDYTTGHLHLYGNAQYFMDNANYMNFKGGISYRF